MNARIHLTAVLIGAGMLATLPLAARTQDTIVAETINVTTYLNGGIGKGDQDLMRRVDKEFCRQGWQGFVLPLEGEAESMRPAGG